MKTPWTSLARWFRAQGRELPWRERGRTPYRVVVSEFMLQQTQVDRVVPLFGAFTARFPDWEALASARQADVVRAWKGLGYNMRAMRLHALAWEVVHRHAGRLPDDERLLLALKGIGPYTSRAILAFAFDRRVLAPDTNVRRVLTRYFMGPSHDPKAFDERRWIGWEKGLPRKGGNETNQALMDLGARICTARKPSCEACPLKKSCRSYPRILKMADLPKMKHPRKEKLVDGLPNRIYRGRFIEALRKKAVRPHDIDTLGTKIRPGYSPEERDWLERVAHSLERDGLVVREHGRIRLA